MKFSLLLLLSFILVFSSCTDSSTTKKKLDKKDSDTSYELVIDLNMTTSLIIEFLKTGEFFEILAPEAQKSEEMIATLIKNFSPAEMAFEAEVLNFKDPVTLLFYDETSQDAENVDNSFKELAYRFHTKSKFVKIEVAKLFKLAELAGIDEVPTLLLINKRAEIGRVEKPQPALFDTEFLDLFNKI